MKILLIDDDHLVRLTLSRVLTRGGHEVVTAADGKRGMTLLHTDPADVVITDILMPEQEGFQTIIMIRRDYPNVKIIAISGGLRQGNHDVLAMAASLGADEVMAKPFEPPDLLGRLRKFGA